MVIVTRLLIREQDPLKQGLKPHHRGIMHRKKFYSRARSIKTRIETTQSVICHFKSPIREQDPLKQGLKLAG